MRKKAVISEDAGETAWAVSESVDDAVLDQPPRPANRADVIEDAPAKPENSIPLGLLGDEPAEEEKASAIDIKRLAIGIWNRKWLVIGVSGVIAALALSLAIFGVSKTWTARSVLIKKEKLDQFQVGNGLNPYRPQQYSFETMLGTLKLPTVLDRTLARSGVDTLSRILAAQVRVARNRDSNLFEIFVEWDSPELAATLTNNLAAVFIDYNRAMRADEAKQAYQYFSKKLEEVQSKASSLDQQIQAYRKEKNIIDIQKQGEAWIQNINDLEIEERAMAAELEELKKTKQKLRELFDSEPEMKISSTLYRNPLKVKKASLELQLEEIRGRYTDENPKVLDLLDQISSIEQLIAEGGDSDTPENTYRENPLRASLQLKMLEHDDNLSLKGALLDSVSNSLKEARAKLKEFTDTREKFNSLVDERESMSALLNDLRNRVEEVSVVMQGTQSDIEVIEPAIPPTESNPTTKRLIAIAGVVLGGGAGLLIALLLEYFDPRIRTRKEAIGLTQAAHVFEIQQLKNYSDYQCALANPDAEMALLIRRIINELETSGVKGLPKVIPVTSIDSDVGRSSFAHSLSIVSAQKSVRTLAVDADLSAKQSGRYFINTSSELKGLADLLSGQATLTECLQATASRNLKYIPAGSDQNRGRKGLLRISGAAMHKLLVTLKSSGSRVVLDLPPAGEYEQVFELLQKLGSVILVVRSGQTSRPKLRAFCERLDRAGIELTAVILTDVPEIYAEQANQFTHAST